MTGIFGLTNQKALFENWFSFNWFNLQCEWGIKIQHNHFNMNALALAHSANGLCSRDNVVILTRKNLSTIALSKLNDIWIIRQDQITIQNKTLQKSHKIHSNKYTTAEPGAWGGGGTWHTNIRGGASGKSKKLPCPRVKLLKMIACLGVKCS